MLNPIITQLQVTRGLSQLLSSSVACQRFFLGGNEHSYLLVIQKILQIHGFPTCKRSTDIVDFHGVSIFHVSLKGDYLGNTWHHQGDYTIIPLVYHLLKTNENQKRLGFDPWWPHLRLTAMSSMIGVLEVTMGSSEMIGGLDDHPVLPFSAE